MRWPLPVLVANAHRYQTRRRHERAEFLHDVRVAVFAEGDEQITKYIDGE